MLDQNAMDQILSLSDSVKDNTWLHLHQVQPSVMKESTEVTISTQDHQVVVDHPVDAMLQILLEYTFLPLWQVVQWLRNDHMLGEDDVDDPLTLIYSLVMTGLIYVEPSVTGEYLRPTHLLFHLYNESPPKGGWRPIPFNQLTHTVSEAQVSWEVMNGINPAVNKMVDTLGITLLPRYSPLDITPPPMGTNVVHESQFRQYLSSMDEAAINAQEAAVQQAVDNQEQISPELLDFKQFMIYKKVNCTMDLKKDWVFHIPDLIIPALRVNGEARSIALEVELTNKYLKRYQETLKVYQGNNRYGGIIWMCNDAKIAQNLRQAHHDVGGVEPSVMQLSNFDIPHPDHVLAGKI